MFLYTGGNVEKMYVQLVLGSFSFVSLCFSGVCVCFCLSLCLLVE